MYKATVDQQHEFFIDETKLTNDWDILEWETNKFHVLRDHHSFNATIISIDHATKRIVVRINSKDYTVVLKDKMDLLLEKMGINSAANTKINQLKAPMPGLVLSILVTKGQNIKKDEGILVLEAMKMENVLKAPADATVKNIAVKQGAAVEKNQLLISFI